MASRFQRLLLALASGALALGLVGCAGGAEAPAEEASAEEAATSDADARSQEALALFLSEGSWQGEAVIASGVIENADTTLLDYSAVHDPDAEPASEGDDSVTIADDEQVFTVDYAISIDDVGEEDAEATITETRADGQSSVWVVTLVPNDVYTALDVECEDATFIGCGLDFKSGEPHLTMEVPAVLGSIGQDRRLSTDFTDESLSIPLRQSELAASRAAAVIDVETGNVAYLDEDAEGEGELTVFGVSGYSLVKDEDSGEWRWEKDEAEAPEDGSGESAQ